MVVPTSVPLSDFSRKTTQVTALLADHDVILNRRDAADLYLSTVERHDRQARTLQITTRALASLAAVRPDLAGDSLADALPWMDWLPTGEKIKCLGDLLTDLRAGAETGELNLFYLSIAAWQSTAIAWVDPELRHTLRGSADPQPSPGTELERPGG